MALNALLRSAGKIIETARTATKVKSPVDSLTLALDKLGFGGAVFTSSTDAITPSLIPPEGSLATIAKQQEDSEGDDEEDEEDEAEADDEDESDDQEYDTNQQAQSKDDGRQTSSSHISTPRITADQAAANRQRRKEHIAKNRREETTPSAVPVIPTQSQYSAAASCTVTAARSVGEDGLEEYESDTAEASTSADGSHVPIPETSNTTPTVTDQRTRDEQRSPIANDAQTFLDNLFADKLGANNPYMSVQPSAQLNDLYLSYDYSSDSLSKPDREARLPSSVNSMISSTPSIPLVFVESSAETTYNSAIPGLGQPISETTYTNAVPAPKVNSATPNGGVDRPRRTTRLHRGIAPYQRHRPNYMPERFTPLSVPTVLVENIYEDSPQVDWPTALPVFDAHLIVSNHPSRDSEVMALDQTVERYYWDERAAAMWSHDEMTLDNNRQGVISIELMDLLNEFAARHPPHFILQRLQELDDILTPQKFQNTIRGPRLTTHLAEVELKTPEEDYLELIQRYRVIYKGYRLFANRYNLPFSNTALDLDADVIMLNPQDTEHI